MFPFWEFLSLVRGAPRAKLDPGWLEKTITLNWTPLPNPCSASLSQYQKEPPSVRHCVILQNLGVYSGLPPWLDFAASVFVWNWTRVQNNPIVADAVTCIAKDGALGSAIAMVVTRWFVPLFTTTVWQLCALGASLWWHLQKATVVSYLCSFLARIFFHQL